ncbi:unnamed protein product, partial [Linum tenue]
SSLVLQFFGDAPNSVTLKFGDASHLKFGDAPNPSSLKLLLPSVLSFLGLKIDDALYCQRWDKSSHEFYHGGSGW